MNVFDSLRRRQTELLMEDMERDGLVEKTPDGKWQLTEKGRENAKNLRRST